MEQDTTVPAGATEDDPFGLVGTWLENKYDVQSVVAAGGFGVVYRAVHRTLHKPVAVKVLKVPPDVRAQSRKAVLDTFIQEARIIARMEHHAIVRVIDFGATPMADGESAPWMVLDWLQGTTLEQEFEDHPGKWHAISLIVTEALVGEAAYLNSLAARRSPAYSAGSTRNN